MKDQRTSYRSLSTPTLSLQIQPQQFMSSFVFKKDPSFVVYYLMTELVYKDFFLKSDKSTYHSSTSQVYIYLSDFSNLILAHVKTCKSSLINSRTKAVMLQQFQLFPHCTSEISKTVCFSSFLNYFLQFVKRFQHDALETISKGSSVSKISTTEYMGFF